MKMLAWALAVAALSGCVAVRVISVDVYCPTDVDVEAIVRDVDVEAICELPPM